MSNKTKNYKGFSLIELLVVVGLIAVLAAVTILALNPARQFANTRNSARAADINTILNAVSQYLTEDGNTVATLITASGGNPIPTCAGDPFPDVDAVAIGQDTGGTSTEEVNLSAALVDQYVAAIPQDPQVGDDDDTGYTICQSNGRITIQAPSGELGAELSVTR